MLKNNKKKIKKICIISDCFIPKKSSAAGMLYNLSKGLIEKNKEVICIFGSSKSEKWKIDNNKLKDYDLKKIQTITSDFLEKFRYGSYYSRFIFEILLSCSLSFKIIKHRNILLDTDLVICYSPSAFLWLPSLLLKRLTKAPLYLILRDIFPDWLINLEIIKNKTVIYFLNLITKPQLMIPDVIGCESINDKLALKKKLKNKNIQTLYNWPSLSHNIFKKSKKSPFIKSYKSAQKKHSNYIKSVYTGNDGVAQDFKRGIDFIINYLSSDGNNHDLILNKFSPFENAEENFVSNKDSFIVKNWGMISGNLLDDIYNLSDFGIVSLNTKHRTNNLPGKFISYIQHGLPVLCFANKNNELSQIILKNNCGCVVDLNDKQDYNFKILRLFLNKIRDKKNVYHRNSLNLFNRYFSLDNAINNIIDHKY